jgi:septum site-determining protein MinC
MAAVLIPALDPLLLHRLRLPAPDRSASALEEVQHGVAPGPYQGAVALEADDWLLPLADLTGVADHLARQGLRLARVRSRRPETLVAAAALGLETESPAAAPPAQAALAGAQAELTIHRGTLRSGDHLQAEGTVLVLGDVNPGARVSAGGHVLIWGRLRGVAHAGCRGEQRARIVALQLRPLQLRIAEAVARGPEDAPPEGLAEQARLVAGEIRIDPVDPGWAAAAGIAAGWP